MANKYFDILKEEGLSEDTEEENIIEPENPEEDLNELRMTVKIFLILLVILTIIEAGLIVVLSLVIPYFQTNRLSLLIGLLIGTAVSYVWFYTMQYQIERIVTPETDKGNGYLKLGAILRIFLLIGLLVLALITRWFHPITLLVGVLNMKITAILTHPILLFLKKRSD